MINQQSDSYPLPIEIKGLRSESFSNSSFMKKAEATRLHILNKSYELIYAKGYQTTSIDQIIIATRLTKGAIYYHFKNKDEIGICIINEIIKPFLLDNICEILEENENPLSAIYTMIEYMLFKESLLKIEYGCPLGNLIQEMGTRNPEFANALSLVVDQWEKKLARSIHKAKDLGLINQTIDADQTSLFLLSGYWGIRNLGKLYKEKSVYLSYLKEIKLYLNNLR